MTGEFDKSILLNNIAFLLRQQGKKVGELESVAGVSSGYLARNKDTASKMNIEFIVKSAKFLNVSLDTLMFLDLTEMQPTGVYLAGFFDKLIKDTNEEKLEWKTEDEYFVQEITETREKALSSDITGFKKGIYISKHQIFRPIFSLQLKNYSFLYLFPLFNPGFKASDPCYEVWIRLNTLTSNDVTFLASGLSFRYALAPKIAELYAAIISDLKKPRVSEDIQAIIDSYMKDDWENDPIDENNLPF